MSKLKVWDFAESLKMIEGGNPWVAVKVETEGLQYRYGTLYNGEVIKYMGIDGRLNDVPAWLGNCTIKHIDEDVLTSGETKYTIYL